MSTESDTDVVVSALRKMERGSFHVHDEFAGALADALESVVSGGFEHSDTCNLTVARFLCPDSVRDGTMDCSCGLGAFENAMKRAKQALA